MLRVSFSEKIDVPRLTHGRKTVVGAVVWDQYEERGRLEWASIGDEDVPFEKFLTNPKEVVEIEDKMINEGRFVYSCWGLNHPDRLKVIIEKYEIRKRIFGTLYGFRTEISYPDQNEILGYMVSKSLPDLHTKIFGLIVGKQDYTFLDEQSSINVMAGW